jgi:hypothetical protein
MFDPTKPQSILTLEDKDLSSLPTAEDDRHEYKSSMTKDNDLADKIAKAASAFWNSGGGLFVAGVNGSGHPDGGIPVLVGRQSRRDWIDQAISYIDPRGPYFVQAIENRGACPAIQPNCAVFLIAFGRSEQGPHMGPGKRYFIRSGAHTEVASHFIVESIWARRHLSKPRLMHVTTVDPYSTAESMMTIELVTITGSPAIDVTIDIAPRPSEGPASIFPLQTTLIDNTHPYSFRFNIPNQGFAGNLIVTYHDVARNQYEYSSTVDSKSCLSAWNRGTYPLQEVAQALVELNRTLQRQGWH